MLIPLAIDVMVGLRVDVSR